MAEHRMLAKDSELPPNDQQLVLLGPMDSGTHLLSWLLQRNYPEQFGRACQGDSEGCKWVWKHSMGEDDIVKVLNSTIGPNLENTSIIAMLRSPLALITGWRNDPWDMKNCVSRNWSSMDEPCSARIGASTPEDHVGLATSKIPELEFTSTMDVVDKYYAQYASLQRKGVFKNVMLVRYEDLVLAPKAITSSLGDSLGWERPAKVRISQEAVKNGSRGRQEAIDRLRNRTYLGGIPAEDLQHICRLAHTIKGSTNLQHVHAELAEDPSGDATLVPEYGNECSAQVPASRHT